MNDKPNKNKPLMTKPQIAKALEELIDKLGDIKNDVVSLMARFFEHDLDDKTLGEAYDSLRDAISNLYEADQYVGK